MLNRYKKVIRRKIDNYPYKMIFYKDYDYSILGLIPSYNRTGGSNKRSYNDSIIMADTETSKKPNYEKNNHNHIVAWTISIRALERNIVTLWGRKPSEMMECLQFMRSNLIGDDIFIYFHNMAYDYVFLRKFLFKAFDVPSKQLNTKPHYPILLQFNNGFVLKDSLILFQRSLEKTANDLEVEHKKAAGLWDYNKVRSQYENFTSEELEYIEHDTLAGVECIDKMRLMLHKHIFSMPFTATGIPREETRKRGKQHNAHESFKRICPDYECYQLLLNCYHGGYTHSNRYAINEIMHDVTAYDFSSSYPFVLLSEKMPMEKWSRFRDCNIKDILDMADEYACIFKLVMIKPCLRDLSTPMPALQLSKTLSVINPVLDNGRIICADYVEIGLTSVDLEVIYKQYKSESHICTDVRTSRKAYLPKWLTDYIYELYADKCTLKNSDPITYQLQKAKLNSCYGMMVQRSIQPDIIEDFTLNEYRIEEKDGQDLYDKYINKRGSIFPYYWGVFCTSYAFRNLFNLMDCADGIICYCDTDSCYAASWNKKKLEQYNNNCKEKLLKNGYGAVNYNGHDYWLGVAELDGEYSEFITQGAKRYCCRDKATNELKITVAGVPKKGKQCLNDDINNFRKGFIFPGSKTGKLTHEYIYVDDIYIDEFGNETGDSIDLYPCDYLLNDEFKQWENIEIQILEGYGYEEE